MEAFEDYAGIIAEELSAIIPEYTIQEEEKDGVKKTYITGRFIRKNFLSENGWFYPEEVVDSFVEQINSHQPPIKTMLTNHFAPDKTLAIVGKLVEAWKDNLGDGFFRGLLADTVAAEEIKKLVKGEFLENVSLRARPIKIAAHEYEGRKVRAVRNADILGIDFTPMPGIVGATIDYMTYEEILKEVTDMNMEELKVQVAELQESLKTRDTQIASLQEEIKKLKNDIETKDGSIAALEEEKTNLSTKVNELTEEISQKDAALKEGGDRIAAFVEGLVKESKDGALAKFKQLEGKKIYTLIEGAIKDITVEYNEDFSKVLEEAKEKVNEVVRTFSEMLEELTPSNSEPNAPEGETDGEVTEGIGEKLPKSKEQGSVVTPRSNDVLGVITARIREQAGVDISPDDLG